MDSVPVMTIKGNLALGLLWQPAGPSSPQPPLLPPPPRNDLSPPPQPDCKAIAGDSAPVPAPVGGWAVLALRDCVC